LFEYIGKYLKKRRGKDFAFAFKYDLQKDYEDPAANDPELARKLEENFRNRKTEEEVHLHNLETLLWLATYNYKSECKY